MFNYGMFNPQNEIDKWNRIKNDAERELNRIKEQMQPVPVQNNIYTNAPNKYDFNGVYGGENEMNNTLIDKRTFFYDKANNKLYIKEVNGEYELYNLEKVIILDDKDLKIQELSNEIKELKELLLKKEEDRNELPRVSEENVDGLGEKKSTTSKSNKQYDGKKG